MSKIISHGDIITVGLVVALSIVGFTFKSYPIQSLQQIMNSVRTAFGQPATQVPPTDQRQLTTQITQQVRDEIAQRYYQCVNENIRAYNQAIEANNQRFENSIMGLSRSDALAVISSMPSPAQFEYIQQQNILRIKEVCRLSNSCASDEILSSDYNYCTRQ